jgi:serine/threonine protein kinase
VKPRTEHGNADAQNPADQLDQLWAAGDRPELSGFLATYTSLAPELLTDVLRVDMQRRWSIDRRTAEYYFGGYPQVATDADCALDLIFHEFLLTQRDQPDLNIEEFVARFPTLAVPLRAQIELHQALEQAPNDDSAVLATASTLAAGPPRNDDPATWKLPRQFGRYRLEYILGHGGMGTIFLARDEQLSRQVAVKVPRFHGDDPIAIDRFYREARIAANLSHPNLCPIHDLGQWQGQHYFTMPQLRGETLAARIRRLGRLDLNTTADLIRTIAGAMDVAHRAGVVHRDLKPANVMITDSSVPIVMDFGLAKSESASDARLTVSGAMVGTPAYLAPELIGRDATPQAGRLGDIYSLGVMMYEMLAGQLPHQGTCAEVIRSVLTQEPPSLCILRPDVDPQLAEICERAMARDPQRRFASMNDFAAALDGWLEPGAGKTPLSQVATSPRFLAGRTRVLLAAATAMCLVLAVLGWQFLVKDVSARTDVANSWQANTTWTGKFRFRPPIEDYGGDVRIVVTDRDGAAFSGTYATENGAYVWEIAGSLARNDEGDSIEWHVVRAVRELEPRPMMRSAHAIGTLSGNESRQVLRIPDNGDPDSDAIADLTLHREDP